MIVHIAIRQPLGNPGPSEGRYSCIGFSTNETIYNVVTKSLGITTNNEAYLRTMLIALDALKDCSDIEFRLNSTVVVNRINSENLKHGKKYPGLISLVKSFLIRSAESGREVSVVLDPTVRWDTNT